MVAMNAFEPKWATPPGATLLDLMQERQLAVGHLAASMRRDVDQVTRLLYGLEPLTDELASILSCVVGSTATFWLKREETYRADLARLCAASAEVESWLDNLPVKDLVRFGWIQPGHSVRETRLNACAFLGVATTGAFERKYERLVNASAYRKSHAFETNTTAVAAWLRKGEIEAAAIDCQPWNRAKLRESLDEIRALTRVADPEEFLPALRQYLAACGVAVVVARSPEGCRASGATRFLTPQKALMQLSFRYRADDQLWFTVFHEIGHLILHTDRDLFLEGMEERHSQAEKEADEFALHALFDRVGVEELNSVRLNKFDIARLAKRAGVCPGVVVGQLQERGRVPFRHFNFMKVRYDWEE